MVVSGFYRSFYPIDCNNHVMINIGNAKCFLTSSHDEMSPLAWKFPRVIGTKISKDTSCISKSKMAVVGHLGMHG